jgi:threonine synthase
MRATVFVPDDTARGVPRRMRRARVRRFERVPGLIPRLRQARARRARDARLVRRFDAQEPYRLEGKKTLGYELAEQFDWHAAGRHRVSTVAARSRGHVESVRELEALGWIGSARPRMVSVQAEGCAPIVRAFHAGDERASLWENARRSRSGCACRPRWPIS